MSCLYYSLNPAVLSTQDVTRIKKIQLRTVSLTESLFLESDKPNVVRYSHELVGGKMSIPVRDIIPGSVVPSYGI